MTISALPTPPLRSDPTSFSTRADAFLGALPTFAEEANALAQAMNLNATSGTSTSAVTLGTGSKTFTVESGKSWQPGMYLVLADAAAPSTNSLFGQVISYAGAMLVVDVKYFEGSGTKSAWVITQSAPSTTLGFAPGTRMPFAQAAAPTGWTQDTSDSADNRMLRVVNTAGNGVGGSHSPVLNNVVPSHTHGFTTGTESADHTHGDSGHTHGYTSPASQANNAAGALPNYIAITAASTATGYASLGGRTAAHTHSGSTDNGSSQTNWQPRYIDLIICSKN